MIIMAQGTRLFCCTHLLVMNKCITARSGNVTQQRKCFVRYVMHVFLFDLCVLFLGENIARLRVFFAMKRMRKEQWPSYNTFKTLQTHCECLSKLQTLSLEGLWTRPSHNAVCFLLFSLVENMYGTLTLWLADQKCFAYIVNPSIDAANVHAVRKCRSAGSARSTHRESKEKLCRMSSKAVRTSRTVTPIMPKPTY